MSLGLRYETQTNIQDLRDFASRVGIAWAPPTKNGVAPKTVVRVGSGVFHGRVGTGLPYGDAAGNIFEFESGGFMNMQTMWAQVNNRLNSKVSFTANYQWRYRCV